MLHPTLSRRLEDALLAFDSAVPLMEVLDSFAEIDAQIEQHIRGIAEGGSKIPENASAIHTQLAFLSRVTKNWSARKLFREVEILESRIGQALAKDLDDPSNVVAVLEQLDTFAEAYNAFVVHPTGVNAVPLLATAARLRISLEVLRRFIAHLRSNSFGAVDRHSDEAEFSLVLVSVTSLDSFVEKLMALQALYAELCYLLNVSAASHPLRVAKIESGSLWTKLFGDTRVVGLMVSLTEGAVKYIHRNFTTEGKIAAIPKKVESLDAILNFSNRLKESGVDVTELQGSLAKSAVAITNNLNALLADQAVVEINGRMLSVATEVQKAALQHSSIPRIAYGDASESPPQLPGRSGTGDAD
ncbi:hypothetical protein RBH89_01390 [Paracidovorax avenae]